MTLIISKKFALILAILMVVFVHISISISTIKLVIH